MKNLFLLMGVLFAFVAAAQGQRTPTTSADQTSQDEAVYALEKVVVKGVIPGPGLWQVTRGDSTLWILGTISPLPKKMQWDSYHVADVISRADVLLLPPKVDADIGFFQSLMLAKTAIGIKKSPNKQLLKDRLPNDLYARWLVLKQKYIGNSRRIEKNRPIVAVFQLFEKALKKSGLDDRPKVNKTVKRLAKKHRLTVNQPTWKVVLNEPKVALKKLKKTAIDDTACFEQKLLRLEEDLGAMKQRAVAWSYGDIATIRSLPKPKDDEICGSLFLNSEFAAQLGLHDVRARLRTLWLEAAQQSLENHRSTFAILPIHHLLGETSLLNELESMGYQVKAPKR